MKKSLDFYLDMGIENLRKFGSVVPVAFINGEKSAIHMMDFSNEDLAFENLRFICKGLRASQVIIMAEAYISHDLSGIHPSKAQDREEAIVVHSENVNGNRSAIIQPFCREEGGKIKLRTKIKQFAVSPWSRRGKILSG